MNEDDRARLRTNVLSAAADTKIQIEWFQLSLKEHLKLEQECMARFRLLDFCGDEQGMTECEKQIDALRAAIRFLQREIPKLQASSPAG